MKKILKPHLSIFLLVFCGSLFADQLPLNLAALDSNQAAEKIRNQQGGRILDVKTVDDKGKRVHLIKILTPDDRVKQFKVDQKTGNLIDK